LDNPNAINAAFDAGIRFMVGDTSVAGWNNPTPNAGIYSTFQPQVLIIPRRPTNLFFNVSTPDKWQAEYNDIYRSYWGRDLSYTEILDVESTLLLQDLLRGANDPWMFHQANTRNYGSGQSLLTDLHDSLLTKYAAASKVPIVSDTMDVLGNRVAMRMTYDRSQAAGVIGPGAQITVSVVNAASVPVTGLCTATAETYAGDTIAYLDLPAGGAATFPLGNCNAGAGGADGGVGSVDAGAGGAAVNNGVGGTLGSGGAAGVGGQAGTGGVVATGMGGDVGLGGTAGAVIGGTGGDLGAGGAVNGGVGGGLGAGGAVNVGTGGDLGSGGALGMGGDLGSGGASGVGGQVGVGGAPGSGAGGGADSGTVAVGGARGMAGFTGSGGRTETGGEGGQSTDASSGGMGGDAETGGMGGVLADAGQTPANPSPNSGCGCSLAERSPGTNAVGLVVALAGLMTRGRRRAKSTAGPTAS